MDDIARQLAAHPGFDWTRMAGAAVYLADSVDPERAHRVADAYACDEVRGDIVLRLNLGGVELMELRRVARSRGRRYPAGCWCEYDDYDHEPVNPPRKAPVPDLSDMATAGVLLGMLYMESRRVTIRMENIDGFEVVVHHYDPEHRPEPHWTTSHRADTLGEAVARALLVVWADREGA